MSPSPTHGPPHKPSLQKRGTFYLVKGEKEDCSTFVIKEGETSALFVRDILNLKPTPACNNIVGLVVTRTLVHTYVHDYNSVLVCLCYKPVNFFVRNLHV